MQNRDYPRDGDQGRGRGRSGFEDRDFDNLRGHREDRGYGRGFEGSNEGFGESERSGRSRSGSSGGGFMNASDRYASEHDADYENWRRQQMDEIDRDYMMWQEERRKKFAEEFEKWRGDRKTKSQAADTSKKQ